MGGDLRATAGGYSAALTICYLALLWLTDARVAAGDDDGA